MGKIRAVILILLCGGGADLFDCFRGGLHCLRRQHPLAAGSLYRACR